MGINITTAVEKLIDRIEHAAAAGEVLHLTQSVLNLTHAKATMYSLQHPLSPGDNK